MSSAALETGKSAAAGLRVSIWTVALSMFIVILFVAQVVTGTDPRFASLVSTYIILSSLAIKVVGGFWTLPGISVAVMMMQHVVVSQVAKVFFLQVATDRLLQPVQTMFVYNLAALGILSAALIYKLFRVERVRAIFEPEEDVRRLGFMAIIFLIISIARMFLLQKFGVYEGAGGGAYIGGFVGPLRQFGFFTTLAVTFSTAHVIKVSNGRRCASVWNVSAILAAMAFGILGAGRQDSVSAVVAFLLTLIAFRFKLRLWHYVTIGLAAYVLQFIIFPYALYARGEGEVRIGSLEERVAKASALLGDVALNPGKYREKEGQLQPQMPWQMQRMYYYGRKIPTLDRYSVINATDNIVNAVLQRGANGPETAISGFYMLLPRFLNPQKEAFGTSNTIAHFGDGLVGESDYYTQITLGIAADGFYCFKYAGAFWLPFLASLAYFTVYRLMFRPELKRNAYVAALIFLQTWTFSEATTQGHVLLCLQSPLWFFGSVLPIMLVAKGLTRRVREAPFIYAKPVTTPADDGQGPKD
ncbi:MAG: hypothetical protein JST30_01025 [Armatimonadetes bacterium]|nr:hypothetical protein [Armatimonadota bacterium]